MRRNRPVVGTPTFGALHPMSTNPSQNQETTDPEGHLTLEGEVVETDRAENIPATGEKLHRIITKYGFTELGDRLEREYTPRKPAPLRELQQKVNVKILDQNMRGPQITSSYGSVQGVSDMVTTCSTDTHRLSVHPSGDSFPR